MLLRLLQRLDLSGQPGPFLFGGPVFFGLLFPGDAVLFGLLGAGDSFALGLLGGEAVFLGLDGGALALDFFALPGQPLTLGGGFFLPLDALCFGFLSGLLFRFGFLDGCLLMLHLHRVQLFQLCDGVGDGFYRFVGKLHRPF